MESDEPPHGKRVMAVIRNGHGQAPPPDGFVHLNDAGNNWHTWTERCDRGVCIPASDLRPVPARPDSVPDDPEPYCWACDHDTHRCHGCGEPLPHGSYACKECSNL